jgi:hypothetical protein
LFVFATSRGLAAPVKCRHLPMNTQIAFAFVLVLAAVMANAAMALGIHV